MELRRSPFFRWCQWGLRGNTPCSPLFLKICRSDFFEIHICYRTFAQLHDVMQSLRICCAIFTESDTLSNFVTLGRAKNLSLVLQNWIKCHFLWKVHDRFLGSAYHRVAEQKFYKICEFKTNRSDRFWGIIANMGCFHVNPIDIIGKKGETRFPFLHRVNGWHCV